MRRKFKLWHGIIVVAFLVTVLSGCNQTIPDSKDWPLDNFTFTDQNENNFGLKNLKGKIWIANFMFTQCGDVCPPMTANMAKLQKMTKKEGLKVEFVSFSVDPENDKPKILKEYAEKFGADLSTWHLLTGYSQKEIEDFAVTNFKALVQKPENNSQVIHGTDFYLVDQKGKVIQYYNGLNDVPYKEIIKHINILQKK